LVGHGKKRTAVSSNSSISQPTRGPDMMRLPYTKKSVVEPDCTAARIADQPAVAFFDTGHQAYVHTKSTSQCPRTMIQVLSLKPCVSSPSSHLASVDPTQLQPHRARFIHAASSPTRSTTHLAPNTACPAEGAATSSQTEYKSKYNPRNHTSKLRKSSPTVPSAWSDASLAI
jgi:hypothetical protein